MKSLLFCLLLLLGACTTIKATDSFKYKEIKTTNFTLASWQKISNNHQKIKIYIEGDGYAFNSLGKPTSNPTPRTGFMRHLAWGDYHDNVVYLARPCQFVKDNRCSQKDWTTNRFSPEIIDAMASAIKNTAQGQEVTLIGYSGGAMIAGLVAIKYPDLHINEVITISGNLNHKEWTQYHKVPPLSGSLDLADFKDEFAKIKQTHYVGENDKVVPKFLTENLISDFSTIIMVPRATHGSGLEAIYQEVWNK